MGWRSEAACRQMPTSLFFPSEGGDVRQAKEVCRRCPVRLACLAEALDNHEPYGIFGGMDGPDRQRLRRRGNQRLGVSVVIDLASRRATF